MENGAERFYHLKNSCREEPTTLGAEQSRIDLDIRYTSKYKSKMRNTTETVGVLTLKVAESISAFPYNKVRRFVSRVLAGTDPSSLARPEVWGPPVQNLGIE